MEMKIGLALRVISTLLVGIAEDTDGRDAYLLATRICRDCRSIPYVIGFSISEDETNQS